MTVAACLIVKNEARVIARCLDSLRGVVQAVVIVDTGSTDDTLGVIRGLAFPVPIQLHERPWVNFAHNRNELLWLAAPLADYLLLLDADQTVEGKLPELAGDAYSLRVRSGRLEFWNTLLIRAALPWRYEGVTHEYLTCEGAAPAVELPDLTIVEHADGGNRPAGTQPRWEWDAAMLEKEVARNPTDTRSLFYLARTYDDLALTRPSDARAGEWLNKAAERYWQRSELKAGYADEVYYSLFRLGVLRLVDGNGLVRLLEAYQHSPRRWEALHAACRWLNERQLYQPSYALSKHALANPSSPTGLFVFPDVYDHLLLFEHSVSAYYVGQDEESLGSSLALLTKKLPKGLEVVVRRNLEYPKKRLAANFGSEPKA